MVRLLLHLDDGAHAARRRGRAGRGDLSLHAPAAPSRRPARPWTRPAQLAALAASLRHQAIMIALLRGRLFEKHPTRVIVETGGVGYEVHVPLSSFARSASRAATSRCACTRMSARTRSSSSGSRPPLEQALFERLVACRASARKLALAVLVRHRAAGSRRRRERRRRGPAGRDPRHRTQDRRPHRAGAARQDGAARAGRRGRRAGRRAARGSRCRRS